MSRRQTTVPRLGVSPLVIMLATGLACGSEADSDVGGDSGLGSDGGIATHCLQPVGADVTGTGTLEDEFGGIATVQISDRNSCARTYALSTNVVLRDGLPANPRQVSEVVGAPILRSGNDMFDGLYAMAHEELRELSVDVVRDGSFNSGNSIGCGDGGCFETGRLWNYVWTRDAAYAVDLGLAAVDRQRALNTLLFKLSERRGGGDTQVVQDTGTGGSYPVSSDRVAWALGASALLAELPLSERASFAARALEALGNTVEHDRRVVWDPADGLYRGEQSFLDWREQSYPNWTATDVAPIAMSKALSTNLLHMRALEIVATLAMDAGDTEKHDRYQAWAQDLRNAIRSRFWLEEEGQFSSFITTGFDSAPAQRYDLLSSALAILFDVATPAEARRILAGYPHYGQGAPVLWPQQQDTPIYHNRGEWPFVSAYWLRAAAHASHDTVATKMVRALMRGAALNLSNMENFEISTGAPWVEEGATSGPVVNSQRQLWSVAGYLSMVHRTIFGLQADRDGLHLRPYLTGEVRNSLFQGTDSVVLNDYSYLGKTLSVVLRLPKVSVGDVDYEVESTSLNGASFEGPIGADMLAEDNTVEIVLSASSASNRQSITVVSDVDYRDVFGPRSPIISAINENGNAIELTIDVSGEASSDILLHVYRDGVPVATDLPGTTQTWQDPTADPASDQSYCYQVATSFASGNMSQHSPTQCWWQRGLAAITVVNAEALSNVGGQSSTNYGRFHFENWGDTGHALTAPSITASKSGEHLFQVLYGNGAGSVDSGITCAVKRLSVIDEATSAEVGRGALIMPHLGEWSRWQDSNVVPASLVVGRTYRVVIASDPDYVNMSAFEHFSAYTSGSGGVDGEFNRVNIAELRILAR